jgi:hypothetical protein
VKQAKTVFWLCVRDIHVSLLFILLLVGIALVCMTLLLAVTTLDSFNEYEHAFQIAFALSCAAMLMGLLLSIGLICEDYIMIRRELHMSYIDSICIIISKTLCVALFCSVVSGILIIPYAFDMFNVAGQNLSSLYIAVFCTMLLSSAVGLFLSAAFRNFPQIASLLVSGVMLSQILFPGFLLFQYARVDWLWRLAFISYPSIRAIGTGLGFNRNDFADAHWYLDADMSNHFMWLIGWALGLIIASGVLLWIVDKYGLNKKLRPE